VVLADDGCQIDPSITEAGQHRPVLLEQFLLLRLRGAVAPTSRHLSDGGFSELRQRVLRVVLEIEPTFVPATVGARQ
jgi:hypothetical protein